MHQLSPHCSYKEATHSKTAIALGIKNEPTERQILNIMFLLTNVFEPLRKHFGVALAVTSLFRSKELNEKIGGSNSSQHLCNNGAAIDIDADVFGGVSNNELFFYIKDNLEFDQLILEDVDAEGTGAWVHVSYVPDRNRKDVLVMQKRWNENKKKYDTIYQPYEEKDMGSDAREAEANEGCDICNGS